MFDNQFVSVDIIILYGQVRRAFSFFGIAFQNAVIDAFGHIYSSIVDAYPSAGLGVITYDSAVDKVECACRLGNLVEHDSSTGHGFVSVHGRIDKGYFICARRLAVIYNAYSTLIFQALIIVNEAVLNPEI